MNRYKIFSPRRTRSERRRKRKINNAQRGKECPTSVAKHLIEVVEMKGRRGLSRAIKSGSDERLELAIMTERVN